MLGFAFKGLPLTRTRGRVFFFALEFKRFGSRIVTILAGAFSLARLAADRLRLQLIDDVLPSDCGRNALPPPPALSTRRPPRVLMWRMIEWLIFSIVK